MAGSRQAYSLTSLCLDFFSKMSICIIFLNMIPELMRQMLDGQIEPYFFLFYGLAPVPKYQSLSGSNNPSPNVPAEQASFLSLTPVLFG
jgi:hypothetical protein